MKKTMIALAVLLAAATTTTFAQEKKHDKHKKDHHDKAGKKYTCPMHPEVISNQPGACPKCGMALVHMKKKDKKSKKGGGEMKM